jgi:hypothetical protein
MRERLWARRDLLRGALSALALPMLPLSACVGDSHGASADNEADAGFDPPPPSDDYESARSAVDAYYSEAQEEAIVRTGLARLEMLDEPEGELDPTLTLLERTADAAEGLRAEVDADFDGGRTVRVQGWVLSRTEADLAALFAILHG